MLRRDFTNARTPQSLHYSYTQTIDVDENLKLAPLDTSTRVIIGSIHAYMINRGSYIVELIKRVEEKR